MPIPLCAALYNEFSQFLQVMLWIVVPVIILSVAVTVIMHYRKKKKMSNGDEATIQTDLENAAENFCYKTADGKFIYLDHTGLLKDLRKKLSSSNAKFAALQQDFIKLQSGKSHSNLFFSNENIAIKKNNMENFESNMSISLQQEDAFAPATGISNNTDLIAQLDELKRSYASLEVENISLLEQVGMQANNGIGFDVNVIHLKEENKMLTAQLTEKMCQDDLLDEKRKQIEFLQGQIDLRVKKYHESEQERFAGKNELQLLNNNLRVSDEEIESLKNELQQKQKDIETLLLSVNEKETALNEAQRTLHDKQAQIIYIENILQELRHQNELLNAAAADSEERNNFLQEQLLIGEANSKILEQKLMINRQLLQRLHNEFADCLKDENEASPVIPLRTDYARVTGEWEETAVQ